MKTMKMSERKELEDELKVKQRQLEEDEARLYGKDSPTMKRKILPIDSEIEKTKDIMRMREIEIEDYQPVEQIKHLRTEWHELNKKFMRDQMDDMKIQLQNIELHKEKIINEIPVLKDRIKEIEDKLAGKIQKADYVG